MPSGYSENDNKLIKCSKCDCFIISDTNSKYDKCIKLPKSHRTKNSGSSSVSKNKNPQISKEKNFEASAGDEESLGSSERIVLTSRRSSVKLIVDAEVGECCSCHDVSSNEKTSSSDFDNLAPNAVKTDFDMKQICFRFCRKKKEDKNAETETSSGKIPEKPPVENKSTAVSIDDHKDRQDRREDKVERVDQSEPNVNDFIQKFCSNLNKNAGSFGGCPGACNTNTIIFPRDKICGDNLSVLENCIRAEARATTKNFEEILNELYKQRREIRELRDLLDLIARTLREQFCTTAIQNNKKAYEDVMDEFCRKTCLERKSNSLSITQSEKENKTTNVSELHSPPTQEELPIEPQSPPKPKKKGMFAWCK